MATIYKLPAFFAVMFLVSCGASEEEKINLLLDKRIRAFELKDSAMYSECIHDGYSEVSGEEATDKRKLVKRFGDQVSAIDTISFRKSERYVYVSGNEARAMILSSIDVTADDYSITYKTKEVINLSKVLGTWKINKESALNLLNINSALVHD